MKKIFLTKKHIKNYLKEVSSKEKKENPELIERGIFVQEEKEEYCDNNFECKSNICVDSKCISGSLIQKIISWFANLFN